MPKKGRNTRKKPDKQEQLEHSVTSIPGDNRNQNHNAKKEALGPNTRR